MACVEQRQARTRDKAREIRAGAYYAGGTAMAILKKGELAEQAWYEKEPYGGFWERGYRDLSKSTMGGPSFEVVEVIPALKSGGVVLDLGCGEGRNSFYLAGLGFDVTAVDRSEAGISKLMTLARQASLRVHGVVADIARLDLVEQYDLIMAHGVLYYLSNPEWRKLLAQAKDRTNPGGIHEHSIFIFNDEYPCPPEYRSARYVHSFRPNELKEFYADWEVLRYDAYVKWDQHPGIPLHCHPIEKIVARKPGGSGPRAIIERVPVGPRSLAAEQFHAIPMGMPEASLLAMCGEPDVVDRLTMQGLQIGVATAVVNGYELRLWYYGTAVIYVINGEVWGRALYETPPTRLRFA
jgi:tellurite methyltransferase